jgi:hypothetical protein
MEFDHVPPLPPEAGGGKEKQRRRRKRRPARVPLAIEAEQTLPPAPEPAVEQKKSRKIERKPRPKARPEAEPKAEAAPDTIPKPSEAEKTPKRPEEEETPKRAEAEPEVDNTKRPIEVEPREPVERIEPAEPQPRESSAEEEVTIPLEADALEAEVFVSDRLRTQEEDKAPAEPAHSEPSSKPQESTMASPPPSPEAPTPPEEPREAAKEPEPSPTERLERTAPPAATTTELPPAAERIRQQAEAASAAAVMEEDEPPIEPPRTRATRSSARPNEIPEEYHPYIRNRERRSLVVGLIIGGLIEHVRHKHKERRRERAHKEAIQKLTSQQEVAAAEQQFAAQKTERTQTALEKQIERLSRRTQPDAAASTLRARTERTADRSVAGASERPHTDRKPEVGARTPEKTLAAAVAAIAPETNKEEQPEVPADRRIETSAWHRIEIDKHTGKAVENPTVAYGEEFQHEQHQEMLRRQIEEASSDSESVKKRYKTTLQDDSSALPPGPQNDPSKLLPAPSQPAFSQRLKDIADQTRTAASKANPVDVGLWFLLILVVLAIIAAL